MPQNRRYPPPRYHDPDEEEEVTPEIAKRLMSASKYKPRIVKREPPSLDIREHDPGTPDGLLSSAQALLDLSETEAKTEIAQLLLKDPRRGDEGTVRRIWRAMIQTREDEAINKAASTEKG